MLPAYSVILFTTASGAGYGLLIWLCLLGAGGFLPVERWFGFISFGLAFGLITAGLLSSTFHLGHPERAWRAFSQWRSSWLSREGVVAVATYIPAGLVAISWVFFEDLSGIFTFLALVAAVLSVVTIGCTAMIYACLATIRQWHNALVLPVYLSLGLATGALLLTMLLSLFGYKAAHPEYMAIALLILAAGLKFAYWHRIETEEKTWTIEQATGLKSSSPSSTVSQLESPHFQDNFVMREMGFEVGRKHAAKLKIYASVLTFIIPTTLLILDITTHNSFSILWTVLSVMSAATGVIIERWLFFAQAQHVVTLYYGAARA